MPQIPIREVAFDSEAGVRITPELPPGGDYDAVYRGAMSVRWDGDAFSLHMLPRSDRTAVEAFQRIVAEVAQEYGDQLILTPKTDWQDVTPAVQAAIRASSASPPR